MKDVIKNNLRKQIKTLNNLLYMIDKDVFNDVVISLDDVDIDEEGLYELVLWVKIISYSDPDFNAVAKSINEIKIKFNNSMKKVCFDDNGIIKKYDNRLSCFAGNVITNMTYDMSSEKFEIMLQCLFTKS